MKAQAGAIAFALVFGGACLWFLLRPDPADCRRLERQTHIVAACVKLGSCLVTTDDLRRLDNLQAACAANDK